MIKGTIDRIEGDWLIVIPDKGPNFQIPSSLFPGFREGNVISISVERDEQGEEETKKRIDDIRKGLNKSLL
jgi:hypothetical protein